MIRYAHSHNGRRCYEVRGRQSLTRAKLIFVDGKEYAIAYMPYTAHWYVFNTETGEECGTLTQGFASQLIRASEAVELLTASGDTCKPDAVK